MCEAQSQAMVGPRPRFGQFAADPGSVFRQTDIRARFAELRSANLFQQRHRRPRNRTR
jgi:hypothetical protein